jgi:hypothetical protein
MTRARDVANLIGSGNYSSTTFTATAGQTAFSISHTQGFVQVFMNGLLLDETVDYTSNGSAVTLTSGAAAGDEIEVVAYNTFSVGDALNQAAADARYLGVDGTTVTTSNNEFAKVQQGTASSGFAEMHIGNDINQRIILGSIGSTYSGGDWSGSRYIYTSHGDLKLKAAADLEMFSGGNTIANHLTQTMNTSGHITNPRQPIIAGTMGTAMTHPSSDTLLSFNVFFVNRGITFNSSTKRFTVPTAGVYSIMLTPFVYGGSHGPHRVLVGINSDTPLYTNHRGHFYTNQTTYDSGALHSVVELAANDYIVFRLLNGKLYNQSSDRFNEFSICKIA